MLDTIRWQVLHVALAGWVNRHQLEVIAYLREENRVLKEHWVGSACSSPIPSAVDWRPRGIASDDTR
jgi:hypothetical protein